MKIADLTTGVSQLRDALEQLQRTWADTAQHWRDENSRHLEEEHLQPLVREVVAAYPVMHELAVVLAQAERECRPWD
jgi:hypothetical protein